jgi:hypothetical protein
MGSRSEVRRLMREFEDAASDGVDRTLAFLASPSGVRLRALVAAGLVVATPMILRHPFFRTPPGRLVQVLGGAALIAKAADAVRDWEPLTTVPARRRPRSRRVAS